ncbi:Uncharacterised protein [Vibrio cholerae]|nr:Uncharacterised protein [Vibrio cholerae]
MVRILRMMPAKCTRSLVVSRTVTVYKRPSRSSVDRP